MKKIFALLACVGGLAACAGGKAVAENNKLNARKIEQCNRILNAPDFVRESLTKLDSVKAEFHENNTITNEICRPFETIICNGTEYRLYDVCFPSKRITYNIAIEEDYL